MGGIKTMNYNQNKKIYQCLSEYHYLNLLHKKQYSMLPEAVKIELSNLTAHYSNLEKRILKLDTMIKDVKRLRESKKKVKHNEY
jgi:hypothetical protein